MNYVYVLKAGQQSHEPMESNLEAQYSKPPWVTAFQKGVGVETIKSVQMLYGFLVRKVKYFFLFGVPSIGTFSKAEKIIKYFQGFAHN